MEKAALIAAAIVVALMFILVFKTVRIVPQARARNIERFGRYRTTLEPGMNFIIPFVDRVKPLIDLREQVVSFMGQPVITEDNLVVQIDTVLYIQGIEQLTATMLRSVIGSMDLEQTLTSRDKINTLLRGVLDDASGKWGIRVTRVEIKAIDPPKAVRDAMEKQMRADREKRAAILTAEGTRQAQILNAEGDKQSAILRAEGDKQAAVLRAEGQAQAITQVFQSIHRNDPDPKLLAYQYLQTLPQLAAGAGNTFWVIPSEVTTALKAVTAAFSGSAEDGTAGRGPGQANPADASAAASGPAAIDPGASGGNALDAGTAAAAAQRAAAALAAGLTEGIPVSAQPGAGSTGTLSNGYPDNGAASGRGGATPPAPDPGDDDSGTAGLG